ncbi:PREDICTED: uncharacterized protein LOC107187489 [Dufourea novaeangliae]|uniref:uncharacterized protein LOC107187489 n=1 Tax=Dufourea novaeangliae TaxID=178035 RepID=UPI000767D19B|nr:PREDICTED: uncharacterized protein LOC107187489 [Dufourea novaeangliae]
MRGPETQVKNSNLSLQWSRWMLKLFGAWPYSSDMSRQKKHMQWLINIVCYFLISFLFVPCGLFVTLEVEDTQNKLRLFGPLSFCVMAYMKYYSLLAHANDIRECIKRIEWDWRNIEHRQDRDIMMENAIHGGRLVKICIFFMYSGFVLYYIALPMSRGKVTAENQNLTFIPMVFPISSLMADSRNSPGNEIFFSIQFFGGIVIHGISAAACSLAAVLAVHVCGQMKVLMCWMGHLINAREDMSRSVDVRIANIVSQHVRILKFLIVTEEALQNISFVEFVGCTLNLCLLGYYFITEWHSNDLTSAITYLTLLISLGFNIFIFCYIGELIAEQCNKVGEMAYMVDWYRLQGKKQRCIVLIIAMSNSSTKLTAGNMVQLSLSTFGDYETSYQAKRMQTPTKDPKKSSIRWNEYEENVDLSIQWNRWILKPMGVWPSSHNVSCLEKSFNRLMNVVCYGLISFLFVPCGLYVMLEVKDTYNKLKLFGPLIFCMTAYIKYYSLMVHANDIRECIRHIEWDWKNVQHQEDRSIMIANANFGRRLVRVCTFFMYSGFLFYYIAVPVNVGKVVAEEGNRTFVPMVFPFSRLIADTRDSPTNEILFSIQLLGGMLIHGIAAGACSLAAAFAVHACGQMEVLKCWMEHLVDGREDMSKSVDVRIANIVSQHVRILKFLALIEKALTQISLAEFLGCTLDICLVGYYIIVEWSSNDMTAAVTYTIILTSLIFNIFIFCYIGELVAEQCKKVGEMSYMIDWYRLPENKKLGLVLIMAMSNSSIKLTAGNLVKLSLTSFSDVVKTSVAFLNMLRTLT